MLVWVYEVKCALSAKPYLRMECDAIRHSFRPSIRHNSIRLEVQVSSNADERILVKSLHWTRCVIYNENDVAILIHGRIQRIVWAIVWVASPDG